MLRWSMRLGSLFGIPIYVHWTFLILILWFMGGPILSGAPDAVAAGLRMTGFVLAIFGCVVLHELGHALAARRYGIPTRDITLLPIGGVARLERMPEKPSQELVVALAGPAVNVVIAAIIIPVVLAVEGAAAFTGPAGATNGNEGDAAAVAIALHRAHFFASLGIVNIFLVVFNMIPALPMDGGRVLRALLAMSTDRARATSIAAAIGQMVAVGFVLLGLFTGHILLMLIGVFVFLGAGAEAHAEQFRSALEGLTVRAAMVTRFRTLRASDTLRHAADELLAGSQQDFPILSDNARGNDDASALAGVLTRSDLMRAMAKGDLDSPISTVMRPPCVTVTEHEDLRSAIQRARASVAESESTSDPQTGCAVIAVVGTHGPNSMGSNQPRIVGLITPENLTELVMLRAATAGRIGK